jgi:hypothetical protein
MYHLSERGDLAAWFLLCGLTILINGRVSVIIRTRYHAAREPLWVTVTVLSDRVELVINSGTVPELNWSSTPAPCRTITTPPR